MTEESYIRIPADVTAKVSLHDGHVIVYYDEEKDEIVVQAASRNLVVRPRAGNSVALALEK